MQHVLIVGLPKGARQLVDSFAKRVGLQADRIYAHPGTEGTHILLPRPEHCLPAISRYFDAYGQGKDDYAGSHVVVLPYAEVPEECLAELDVAQSMGARVYFPNHGQDATWPSLSRRKRPDQEFHVALAKRLIEHLQPLTQEQGESPSAFIRKLAQQNPQLLIADGALDECDKVAPHRHIFIRNAVVALADAVTAGLHTRMDEHCSKQGLHHAQTGGSKFTVSFQGGTERRPNVECHTHIKRGDNTTREAAARVYYTFLDVHNVRHVAILYAGPHPDGDQSCRVDLPK